MLYKYRMWDDYAVKMIKNGEFYFAPRDKLNDPLDCSFFTNDILEVFESVSGYDLEPILIELISTPFVDRVTECKGSALDILQKRLSQLGILSLSKNINSSLMWSHYADGHKGIAVGIDDSFFDDPAQANETQSDSDKLYEKLQIIGGYNVTYKQSPDYVQSINRFVSTQQKIIDAKQTRLNAINPSQKFLVDILTPVTTTKSTDWSYEEEYRVIRHKFGPLNIKLKHICEVVVGNKAGKETVDKLKEMLKNPDLAHIKLKKAEFMRNSFDMNIVNLT